MTDQHRSRERDHWQAIAEQLGLATEGGPSSPAPAAERKMEPRLEKRPAPESERAPVAPPDDEVSGADLTGEGSVYSPAAMEPAFASEAEKGAKGRDALPSPATSELQETTEDDSERRPRRRGRRPRKERDEPGSPAEHSEASAVGASRLDEPAGEHPDDDSGRRGRGRGRPRKAKPSIPPPEVNKEIVGPESAEEDDVDEMSDFTNWTVPNWNELIASLYRPGR
jgi:hypothetical protein